MVLTSVGLLKHKDAVEVGDGNGVPGITGQRARFESLDVVDEIGDDNFHEFVREGAGRLCGGCPGSCGAECAVDPGFAPVPDDASEEVEPFAAERMRWSETFTGWFLGGNTIPDTEDIGLLE